MSENTKPKTKMTTTSNIEAGIKSLKEDNTARLCNLTTWAHGSAADTTADLSELTKEEIISQGFSPDEADALFFIMNQDFMGRACINADEIGRWLAHAA